MSVVYNEMLKKKSQLDMLEQQGKRKYEYDSDEDTEVNKSTFFHEKLSLIIILKTIFREELGSTRQGASRWRKL